MAFTVPGIVVVIFVLWYSLGIWRSTDRYFREEYRRHLQEYPKDRYLQQAEINERSKNEKSDKSNGMKNDKFKQDEINKMFEDDSQQTLKMFSQKYETISHLLKHKEMTEKTELADKYKKYQNTKITEDDWEDDNVPPYHTNTDNDECLSKSKDCQEINMNTQKDLNKQHESENDFCPITNNNDCGN
ncbi:uncharacterized protein LOC142324623 [Lycorma delicatula]|uniref:uncharacterized protein LOC142324623 n=1 Tax=Lycorma delicatula TaxID=130591 RepID=UPI003F5147CF